MNITVKMVNMGHKKVYPASAGDAHFVKKNRYLKIRFAKACQRHTTAFFFYRRLQTDNQIQLSSERRLFKMT